MINVMFVDTLAKGLLFFLWVLYYITHFSRNRIWG